MSHTVIDSGGEVDENSKTEFQTACEINWAFFLLVLSRKDVS